MSGKVVEGGNVAVEHNTNGEIVLFTLVGSAKHTLWLGTKEARDLAAASVRHADQADAE